MDPETETFTPAVERAAKLLIHEAETTGLIRDDVRNGLAAALDIEEMAREMFVADSWQDRDFVLRIWFETADDSPVKKHWRRIAQAVRTALLGADS